MKRVLCLYRVSTLKQVDKKDDIPMQRRECMDFISRMEGWTFYGERMEKGVSGYKVSANDRDIIVEIRDMATRKEFDVLLVFMFDRLGRKEDETPFLVKWFIDHGIEVWSTREGQQKLDNQVDRLMNYMRFWAASGESEKTSIRVKAAHTQMTQDGIWRGGACPYGYRLVHKGRIGKKNRPLYDLEIDEDQAAVVREIFDLLIQEGYGTHRIAMFLNEKYPDSGKTWHGKTIRDMVRNPIYTGRMHMNDLLSEPIENLRIVSDEAVAFGRDAIAKRIPSKYVDQTEAENLEIPENTTKASVFGSTLLNGILYCGHCGKKLVGGYAAKHRQYYVYRRPIYRCYNGGLNPQDCDGPRTYSGTKLETAVKEAVYAYFGTIKESANEVWQDKARQQIRTGAKSQLKQAEATLNRLQKEQDGLKKELLRVVTGTSSFDRDLLQSMLEENRRAQEEAEETIRNVRAEADKVSTRLQLLDTRFKDIVDWGERFDLMSVDEQRAVLNQLIERVEVSRDYHIKIRFAVSLEDFFGEEVMKEQKARGKYLEMAGKPYFSRLRGLQ